MQSNRTAELKERFWERDEYIELSAASSLEQVREFWYPRLVDVAKAAKRILDVGCSDGTRLNLLCRRGSRGVGVDVSERAMSLARSKFPHLTFSTANIERLPFPDRSFELVYATFVLEHTPEPERVIDEMIRVSARFVAIVCPNYGSPFSKAPTDETKRVGKFVAGALRDVRYLFALPRGLRWRPLPSRFDRGVAPDEDIAVEPYLPTLAHLLHQRGLRVSMKSSGWETFEWKVAKRWARLVVTMMKTLRLHAFPPFSWWGPDLFVLAERRR